MHAALEKEQRIEGYLKVRSWRHASTEPLTGAASVHHALELCWVSEGRAVYEVGSKRFEVRAGDAMVVPAGVEHVTTLDPGSRAGSLWIGADEAQQLDEQPRELQPGLSPCGARVISIASGLQQAAFDGAPLEAEALCEQVLRAVLGAQPRHASRNTRAPGIRRAVEHIEAHYAAELSLDELAHAAAMSRFHFARRFRDQVGLSPYAYVQRVRLERAAELLTHGRPVTEAAFTAGFTDLGRFGRKFREAYGCTPGRFARH